MASEASAIARIAFVCVLLCEQSGKEISNRSIIRKLGIFVSTQYEWNILNSTPLPFCVQVSILVGWAQELFAFCSICRFFTHGKMSTSRWTRLAGRTLDWIQLGIATRRHYISIWLVLNLFVVLFFFLLFFFLISYSIMRSVRSVLVQWEREKCLNSDP